jgi:hypothetical protein
LCFSLAPPSKKYAWRRHQRHWFHKYLFLNQYLRLFDKITSPPPATVCQPPLNMVNQGSRTAALKTKILKNSYANHQLILYSLVLDQRYLCSCGYKLLSLDDSAPGISSLGQALTGLLLRHDVDNKNVHDPIELTVLLQRLDRLNGVSAEKPSGPSKS